MPFQISVQEFILLPKDKAAEIAIEIVKLFQLNSIEEVIFVCFDDENYELYKKNLI